MFFFFFKVIFEIKFKEIKCKTSPKEKVRPKFKEITCKRFKNKTKELVILKICGQCFLS